MRRRFGFASTAVAAATFTTILVGSAPSAHAQASVLTCTATVNPILVRGEGLTERMGDILLGCAGGVPNAPISGNLTVFLSVTMTNRVDSTGTTDLSLTIDSGNGPQPANATARYLNPTSLSFSGLAFTLSPTGGVYIRLSNLRGAANQLGVNSARQITASLSFTGGQLIAISNNIFPVGTNVRSLYSSSASGLICAQTGSPSIDNLSMSTALAAGASYATVRVTEGFPSAFAPKTDLSFQNADFGTRIVVRFSNVPGGVHIYAPVGVVGYDGNQPTSAGDYGLTPGDGSYSPGNGTLLLLLIANADSTGGGSTSGPAMQAPSTTTVFDALSEITIAPDGTGQAVYEVFDSNNSGTQSATIPTFIYVPPGVVNDFTEINEDVVLGPTSTSLATDATAVVPRFVPIPAPNDCGIMGDCQASYFPQLSVSAKSLIFNATSLNLGPTQYPIITNTGGGNFVWNASVQYLGTAAGAHAWLSVQPIRGVNNATLTVNIYPQSLAPGYYQAVISIDAGPSAGPIVQIPVTLYWSYQAPTPIVINAVNPANMTPGNLVPGSQAAILGSQLTGHNISVTFNGSPATVLNSVSASRLDVEVPYNMAGQSSALIVVNIDGSLSSGFLAPIGVSNPAIFPNSILNQNNTGNNQNNGAVAGTTISVYATGLPVVGSYSGLIHDRSITGDQIVYAGPAPTLLGVQLMQMIVPADLPSMNTGTAVCGGPTDDTQTCSAYADLTIVAAPLSGSSAVNGEAHRPRR